MINLKLGKELLSLFCLLLNLQGFLQQSCVNLWEADTSDLNAVICPVATESGEYCQLPFTYDNQEYRSCIINGPNNPDKLPKCLTAQETWAVCKVPTNAVVTMVTTRKNGSPSVNGVSLNGGTLLWITGLRFALNLFSFNPTDVTSNQVILANSVSSYDCQIHADKVTSTQITCYSPALPAGTYLIRIKVNGNLIPLYQYDSTTNAVIIASDSSTPKIYSISPTSGVPGSFVTITGNFRTECYTRDVENCADDSGSRISRVYFGGQICDLIDPVTNTLYTNLTAYSMTCKLMGAEINVFNASILVSEEYGRSLTSGSAYYVTADEKIYNFQTYPEIKNITPQTGSVAGGTYLTLIGSYFYSDEYLPAKIDISGTPCTVISYEKNDNLNSKLVCQTASKPANLNDFNGGRGVTLIRDNVLTSFSNLSVVTPSGSAVESQLNNTKYLDTQRVDVTVWMKGFIVPGKSSNYEFNIQSNGPAVLYLSTDATSSSKLLIAYNNPSNSNSSKSLKYLEANKQYYFEAVGSKQSGALSLSVNAKMLDTSLTDKVSSNVKNEIQDIEITSSIVPESLNISYGNLNMSQGVQEVQQVILNSSVKAPFVLSFDGVDSVPIQFESSAAEIQKALNDLPTLSPTLAVVAFNESADEFKKIFTITFSSNLGDVPMIGVTGVVNSSFTELVKGSPSGKQFQLLIENTPTVLFDVTDTASNIKSAIDKSFGIQCPVSIQNPSSSDASKVFDYETNCVESNLPSNETAFCGKFSLKNSDTFFNDIESPMTYKNLCFAYKLTKAIQRVNFLVSDYYSNTVNGYVNVQTIADFQWHYLCVDLSESSSLRQYSLSSLTLNYASFTPSAADTHIDAVSIRKTPPFGYDDSSLITTRRLYPALQIFQNTLNVTKVGNSSLIVSYRPNNCSFGLRPVTIRQQFSVAAKNLNIDKYQLASPPVTGSFNLVWNGETISSIPSNITESSLKNYIESIKNFGSATVQRSKDCAGYKWRVKWNNGGDKTNLLVTSSLSGSNPNITVTTVQDGSVNFYPLPDDMLRTYHSKPQIVVSINNITSKCVNSCNFEWSEGLTPVVNSIDTSISTAITITGTGFDVVPSNNIVLTGQTLCNVTSSSETQIVCKPGNGPVGFYNFTVNVLGKGFARMNANAQFEFQLTSSGISPIVSGTGGGINVNITGSGFSRNTLVKIDAIACKIVFSSYSLITCLVPANPTNANKSVDVILTEGTYTNTLSQKFFYDSDNTPVVTDISPSKLSVLGGERVSITGTNLPTSVTSVLIGNKNAKVISNTANLIVIDSPAMSPGLYELKIPAGSLGNIKVSNLVEYQLYVSSVSPKIGSIRGGSLVNVYGEGFSTNCSLNKVSFREFGCNVVSCTSTSITCQTTNVYTVHEVTNNAFDNVYGFRYAWDRAYFSIKVGEVVSWSWSPPTAINGLNFKVEEVSGPSSTSASGFTSGVPTSYGSFSYQFNKPGTYHYWSGFVDSTQEISFRGVIVVEDSADKELEVQVSLNGFEAQKCSFPFEYKTVSYNSCISLDQTFNWCSPNKQANGQILKCDPLTTVATPSCSTKVIDTTACNATSVGHYAFKFTSCQVPEIRTILPLVITYNSEITITGVGFSSTTCENEVHIDGKVCPITGSSATEIKCKIGKNFGLEPNKFYGIEVLVKNIGHAIHKDFFLLKFQQVITSVSPAQGSTTGGSKVTILGDGFTKNTLIRIGSSLYSSSNANITSESITLTTKPDEGSHNVTISTNGLLSLCDSSCTFGFSSVISPVVDSVSPLIANDTTEITLVGRNFVIDSSLIRVKIGNEICNVLTSTVTQIKCQINGLGLGSQKVFLNIETLGNSLSNNLNVTGLPSLKSVTPTSGSIHGGTRVVIVGNGFSNSTNVNIDNSVCKVVNVTSNQITCVTSAHQNTDQNLLVQITTNNQQYENTNIFFKFDTTITPVITALSPISESSTNSLLTITGTGFSTVTSEVHVSIGGSECAIQSSTATQITCLLGINSAGVYPVLLRLDSKGVASNSTQFSYELRISSLSNSESGVAGGISLVINGVGFSPFSRVNICNKECKFVRGSNTEIICIVPQSDNLESDSSCTLQVNEKNINVTSSFAYKKSITPQLNSVSPTRGGTGGGSILTILGTNLPTNSSIVKVLISNTTCDIISLTQTEITCATGSYLFSSVKSLVQVYVDGVGLALNSNVFFEYIDLWSSRFTWGGSEPPREGELVVISQSQTVYFDAETPVLKGLIILGGSLIFDDNQNVHLKAEYIVISDGGKLQIGTAEKPFLNKAKITMYGSVRSMELPIFGSKVIALRNGTIDIHGKPVGVTWTHLSQTASAGSNQITIKEPLDWEVGSELVIATTSDKLSQGENEVRKITGVSVDKRTLTLDKALKFTHLSETRTVGSGSDTYQVQIRAEVGLLSRNVVIQGHNDDTWNSLKSANACPTGFDPAEFATMTCFLGRYGDEIGTDEFGATIMISSDMSKPRTSESVFLRLSNVELFHVGQAFRLGRYPIHFHMNGDMPSSYVKECAIHESFNRAINIHATNYVTIERNLIYNIMGGAYFLEDGVEIGNTFKYNLAVFVKTSSSLLNEDVTPAAYWVTNPNNTYLHNAVAGGTHFGFWYRILDKPDGPSFNPNYCPKKMPMGKFFNNTVHAVGRFGLWIFPGYTPTVSGACSDSRPSAAKFEHFTSYSSDKGAEWVMSNNLQFRNFVSFDHASAGIETKTIVSNENVNTAYGSTFYSEELGPLISDSIIIGNSDSTKRTSITPSGLIVAWDRGQLVKNVSFFNFPDSSSNSIRATEITGRCLFGCGGWTTKYSGLKFSNVLYKTIHRWDWDLIYHDLDGSLTGTANNVIVYNNNLTKGNPNCQASSSFLNGLSCSGTKGWIRFSFNKLSPEYVVLTNLTNSNGNMATTPKLAKRLTHKEGFMTALEADQEYLFEFDQALYPTNVSYLGTFSSILPGQYVIIKHKLLKKPDRVEYGSGMTSTESFFPLTSASNKGEWHWDNDTSTLSYILSNKEQRQPFLDIRVSFSAYRCRYVNCIPPIQPAFRLPITARPADALFWSNSSTWAFTWSGVASKNSIATPTDFSSVIIPENKYIVVDCPLPKLKYLQIEGYLELDNKINHTLEAEIIFINGGQLIIGWEKDPILTDVQIILTGVKDSLNYKLPNGLDSIGGKGIGVYGGLDIHGKPRTPSWTRLETTATVGANQITLSEAVDWKVGEQIVLTTTSYIINQSEVFTISAKSANNKTLTLSSNLAFEHLAYTDNLDASTSYKIAAGVGLLSRNVKVIGSEYTKQLSDLYGFRIIVSDYSTMGSDGPLYYKGYARLSNVEFNHPGQYSRNSGDDFKYGVLFSNLGEYNSSRPSYVQSCAFHHGYSAAIGITDSASIPIVNNVIYHTVDFSIRVTGHSNIIRKNLVVSNIWGSSYMTWEAEFDREYWGAIDLHLSDSIVLEDNFIAGSERVGVFFKGDTCLGQSLATGQNHSIKNNIVYSTLAGVVILPTFYYENLNCIKISGFTVFKASHWGIYHQSPASLIAESNTLVDNQVNLFSMVINPSILGHTLSNKTFKVSNSIIVGQSNSFNCLTDIKPNDLNFKSAKTIPAFGAGLNSTGKIGLVWANFLSAQNKAPYKPWAGIMSYNSLDGLMTVENVTFAHFKPQCNGSRDYAIATSRSNDDGQHPVEIKNSKLFDVDNSSKVWIHRPNPGKINPSDCVDMDCDGMKKNLLTDTDGTFLGAIGSVISQSEFEWGSQQKGLGDFRIPKEALAAPNGSMLSPSSIYKYPGIVRDESLCTYIENWQAYHCASLIYKMLIIESMDPDTENRRLSPVAILADNKYLDLINGPQDHGWCFGYTCQKRVSTFMALVLPNKNYDIYLTSTPPNQLRFRILNADASFKIRISMHYFSPNRIDIYKNDMFKDATNAEYISGKLTLKDPSANLASYMPTTADVSGTNLAVREDRKVYVTVGGGDYIDLKRAPVIVLKFGLPAVTPDSFFNSATLVQNIADLLNIDASKIRRVEIVRASRRRRDASNTNTVSVTIFENPVGNIGSTSQDNEIGLSLKQLAANVSNQFTTGQLQENAETLFGISLTDMIIEKPFSNSSGEVIKKIDKLFVVQEASKCREQSPCEFQPILTVLDNTNKTITGLYNSEFPFVVVASLVAGSSAEIISQSEAILESDGYIRFKNLAVSQIGQNLKIQFKIKLPPGVKAETFNPFTVEQTRINSTTAILACKSNDQNLLLSENEKFNLSASIIDKISKSVIKNISWRNHVWQAKIFMYTLSKCQSTGKLYSVSNTTVINATNGNAVFQDLYIDKPGMYILNINVNSADNEYNLTCLTNSITIKPASKSISFSDDQQPSLYLKFNATFSEHVDKLEQYKSMIYNCIIVKHSLTLTRTLSIYEGSIELNTAFEATSSNVAAAKAELAEGFNLTESVKLYKMTLYDTDYSVKVVSDSVSEIIIQNQAQAVAKAQQNTVNVGLAVGLSLGLFALIAIPISIFVGYKIFEQKSNKAKMIHPIQKKNKKYSSQVLGKFGNQSYDESRYEDMNNDDRILQD